MNTRHIANDTLFDKVDLEWSVAATYALGREAGISMACHRYKVPQRRPDAALGLLQVPGSKVTHSPRMLSYGPHDP